MTQQIIDIGAAANDRTGDTWRDAMDKSNDNFTELYDGVFPTTSQVINVYTISDFPDAVGGVITLEPSTIYMIFSSINFGATRMVMSANTMVQGAGSLAIVLIYTGTASFFTAPDTACVVSNMTILAQSSGAHVITYSTTSLRICRIEECTILCDRFADFSGTDWAVRITNVTIFPFITGAITCSGTCRSFQYFSAGIVPTTGIIFDLGTCVFNSLVINTIVANLPTGSTFISGLANSGNVSSAGRALVESCQLNVTGGTTLTGVTTKDARWQFVHNTPIEDTREDYLIEMDSNATNTVITTNGVYTRVLGTWDISATPSQFTIDVNGRATYVGVEDLTIPLDALISVEPASGNNKDYAIKFFSSSAAAVIGPTMPVRMDAGNPQQMAASYQLTFSTNDFVEVYIANVTVGGTDTTDVLVSGAVSRGN